MSKFLNNVPLSRRSTQQTLNKIMASKKMSVCLYSCVFKTYLQTKNVHDIYRLKRTCPIVLLDLPLLSNNSN